MADTKAPLEPAPLPPRDTPLAAALSERYLNYALSTIMARSLPDVRDGLKPVQRRLVYAMRQLRLDPGAGFKKSARIVGDVIGKYHPHGDQAVYDALVRLAQEFAARYPLIDGQGNFGNVDGDNAAAFRYTEARLTDVAASMLEGLEEDAVDYRPNYDGDEQEPVVLPAGFPNLLANGAQGIAVGMATSIPPHNAAELCDALLHLVKHPNAAHERLVKCIKGPDFPTGGIVVEPEEAILEAYRTGRGGFRLRARWDREDIGRGQYVAVITEIPYQVQKSRLIEKIADLITNRRLPLVGDVRDESAETVRIVIEPKSRTVDPVVLMESLYRATDLEIRVPLNMNVLDGGVTPRVMSLREVLQAYLDHRIEVLERRTHHRLERIAGRLEVLEGYLVVYRNLDEVIRIIREEDEPKPALAERFKLTDGQAEAILSMRLRALRRLEEAEIKAEHKALKEEAMRLRALLKDRGKRLDAVAEGIKEIRKRFGPDTPLGARRTTFAGLPAENGVDLEVMTEREPITVICSEKGWIRAVKGHLDPDAEVRYKEGDGPAFRFHAETADKLLLFATNGRAYTLAADRLPGGRGQGEPVRLMFDLANDQDIVALLAYRPGEEILVAASDGRGFRCPADDVVAATRNGKAVLNVRGDVEGAAFRPVPQGADMVAAIGENGKLVIFPLEELPVMTRGRGIVMQRYKDGGLADAAVFRLADGLSWRAGSRTRTETGLEPWLAKRGAAGRLGPNGLKSRRRFGA